MKIRIKRIDKSLPLPEHKKSLTTGTEDLFFLCWSPSKLEFRNLLSLLARLATGRGTGSLHRALVQIERG